MRKHQETYFLDGARKLGLLDEPHYKLAAKYHVLSNWLGGVDTAYAEDDEGRAWYVQYPPLAWGASPVAPGPGILAVPSSVIIESIRAWEANNGVLLGNDRLRFTVTDLATSGGPYDAGYFDEAPRALRPEERLRVALDSARFTPGPRLELGVDVWPDERRNAALRKFSAQYALGSLAHIAEFAGIDEAAEIGRLAMTGLFVSWSRPLLAIFSIHEPDPLLRTARLLKRSFELLGDELTLERERRAVTLVHHKTRLSVPEYPGWEVPPVENERSLAQAWTTVSRAVGAEDVSVHVARSRSQEARATEWLFRA
jgi:hypothetical protein